MLIVVLSYRDFIYYHVVPLGTQCFLLSKMFFYVSFGKFTHVFTEVLANVIGEVTNEVVDKLQWLLLSR